MTAYQYTFMSLLFHFLPDDGQIKWLKHIIEDRLMQDVQSVLFTLVTKTDTGHRSTATTH